jgi:hypothetical protein
MEYLWPDWMHKLVKFVPINIQEANGPIILSERIESKDPNDLRQTTTFRSFFPMNFSFFPCIGPLARVELCQ